MQAQQDEAYLDRESDTVTPTVNEVRSFPTVQMLSEVQSKSQVRARTELHAQESTKNRNENRREGGPTGPRRGGKMA